MKGSNVIHFCAAQMAEALEMYLKEHFLKDHNFIVKSVSTRDGVNFDINVDEVLND